MQYYDGAILEALAKADRPLRHRDLVQLIDPNDTYRAFNAIGVSLSTLYKDGRVDREMGDDHKYHYWLPKTPRMSPREELTALRAQIAAAHAREDRLREALEETDAMYSWLQSFFNDVMNTAPEYIERCGDWNATQYMMQDCAGIANRARAALADEAAEGTHDLHLRSAARPARHRTALDAL